MNYRLKALLLNVLVLGGILLFGAAPVYAQLSEGVQIKPAVIDDAVQPGAVYHYSMTATNISPSERTFFIGAEDITGLDDSGLPIFSNVQEVTQYELSSWVSLSQRTLIFKPGEEKIINFDVKVPKDASPGSHFGGVFLDTRPPTQQQTNGASVGMKVGAIISLRIAGDAKEEARLREFSTDKLIYGVPSVTFNSKVENLGNVLVRPNGFVEISNMFGKKMETIRVNDSGASTFPGHDKTYQVKWDYDGFAFGRYEAVASLVYGETERKTISATTSFWVLPLEPILIALGSLLAIIVLFYMLIRSYIQAKLRQMGVSTKDQAMSAYSRHHQKSVSRLTLTTIAVVFFTIVFLLVLFFMFA